MDGCVGVWVVLWWVSSPHIKNVSSPHFWPSVQACMSLCGFPAVSSHSSKNVHTEKLPPGCECLSCDELDLMSQCIKAHTCVHLPLYHSYSFSCTLAPALPNSALLKRRCRPDHKWPTLMLFKRRSSGIALWGNPLLPLHHSPSASC